MIPTGQLCSGIKQPFQSPTSHASGLLFLAPPLFPLPVVPFQLQLGVMG